MFVNLTPHALTIAGINIAPSGTVARVSATYTDVASYDGVPVVAQTFGQITDLPDPQDGVVYIVSGLVRSALGNTRPDVVAPDTGTTALRNADGQIIGVTRLVGVML